MLDIHLSGASLRRATTQFLTQSQFVSSFYWHGCRDNCVHTSWPNWQKQRHSLWIGKLLASPRVPVPGQGPPFPILYRGQGILFPPLSLVSLLHPLTSLLLVSLSAANTAQVNLCFALLLQSHGHCKPLKQPPIIGIYSYHQTLLTPEVSF